MRKNKRLRMVYATGAAFMISAAMLVCGAAFPAHGQTQSLLPINSNFSFWDHHWIMWIPQHPVYEAVEVLSLDDPRDARNRLIRIFFTERGGKQVQYFSDPTVAKNWRTEAYFRDIQYRTEGEFGKPLNLYVKFKDKDERLVELTVEIAKGESLTTAGSGLKAQGSHASDVAFLLFYNGPAVTKTTGTLLIDGKDYSAVQVQDEGVKRFYQTAYSFNAYTAVIAFGKSRYDNFEGGLRNSFNRLFKATSDSTSGKLYRSNRFGYRASDYIEVVTNSKNEILSYKHFQGEHLFKIDFNPALPNINSAQTGQQIRYQMSLDSFKNLVTGIVSIKTDEKTIIFDWQHEAPAWAKSSGFQSVVHFDSGGYDLEVATKK
jgi:hypothetical protein